MSVEGVLKTWPKHKRVCNLGDCPAFHLEKADIQYLSEAEEIRKENGIDAAIAELGVPSGTCLAKGVEVVVNSSCTASDAQFIDYLKSK